MARNFATCRRSRWSGSSTISAPRRSLENLIDLNQIVHRAGRKISTGKLKRLNDWAYVRALVEGQPIASLQRIQSRPSTRTGSKESASQFRRGRWTRVELMQLARAWRPKPRLRKPGALCGAKGAFVPGPNGRPDAGWPWRCGSLERHRFLALAGPLLRHIWITAGPLAAGVPSGGNRALRGDAAFFVSCSIAW